jgi:hypothetical protein
MIGRWFTWALVRCVNAAAILAIEVTARMGRRPRT